MGVVSLLIDKLTALAIISSNTLSTISELLYVYVCADAAAAAAVTGTGRVGVLVRLTTNLLYGYMYVCMYVVACPNLVCTRSPPPTHIQFVVIVHLTLKIHSWVEKEKDTT